MANECQPDKYKCIAALSAHGHMLGGLGQAVHQAGWPSSAPTQPIVLVPVAETVPAI